jgi:hypothetical protein
MWGCFDDEVSEESRDSNGPIAASLPCDPAEWESVLYLGTTSAVPERCNIQAGFGPADFVSRYQQGFMAFPAARKDRATPELVF